MPWLQLHFNIDKTLVEPLEKALFEHGAQSISLADAQDEAQFEIEPGDYPLWSSTILSALFDAKLAPQALLDELHQSIEFPLPSCDIEILEDKDWEREWMTHFQPMQMGVNLWICPSWLPAKDPNATNLFLDPGLAFGTGTHPTTALCLEWLDALAIDNKLQLKQVVDYGCGSGILSIAALLLGAKHVLAVDHDAQAITATHDNRIKNKIPASSLDVFLPQHEPSNYSADIVIANILAQPLITLVEKLASFCNEGSLLVLSGILKNQANSVCICYEEYFTIVNIQTKGDWVRIECKRKAKL